MQWIVRTRGYEKAAIQVSLAKENASFKVNVYGLPVGVFCFLSGVGIQSVLTIRKVHSC